MKSYISRPLCTNKIEPFIGKDLIKVITDQRRICKSYILLQISDIIKEKTPEANIIFIDKELLAFADMKNYMDLYQYVLKKAAGHNYNYLFVDEVQEIEEFQLCLRSLLNENICDIYCTESNAKMLSGELATHLAGRYIEFPVHSLSYEEFLRFNQLQDSPESLRLYLMFGGMPYIHNLAMDISESEPLNIQYPEKVRELKTLLDDISNYAVEKDVKNSFDNLSALNRTLHIFGQTLDIAKEARGKHPEYVMVYFYTILAVLDAMSISFGNVDESDVMNQDFIEELKKWYDYREFAVELSKMITNHLDCVCNNIPTKRENPHSNYRRRKTD